MVKHRTSGDGVVAPFLTKCYEMVDDEDNKRIVSWSDSRSNSFVINDQTQFALRLLPKYWKHNNFSSFMRQLNIYGFKKIEADRWEFANDGFVKGEKHLLSTIARRKNIQATTDHKKAEEPAIRAENDSRIHNVAENIELCNEVRDLQMDKNVLMQELIKLRQHQETADNKLLLLRERLQGMEKNQQQMLSFLVMAVQNPGYFVKLLQPRGEHNFNWVAKNANILERVMEVSEAPTVACDEKMLATSDGTVVRYQQLAYQEDAYSPPSPPETTDIAEGMDEFFMNSDLMRTLMDENEPMVDDHSSFVLPDLHDDAILDHFIFSSPVVDNTWYANHESPRTRFIKTQQMELALEKSMVEQMDTITSRENRNPRHCSTAPESESPSDIDSLEKSQDLVHLTERMKDLVSNKCEEDTSLKYINA
uniref:Heat stress transcription factor A-8 n=1 Tax=Sedum alfredii TaxID=439688 RepID=A0A650AVF7_9MAGN|nr:heat stress transcription factor A-8 [Sedum alfredii]